MVTHGLCSTFTKEMHGDTRIMFHFYKGNAWENEVASMPFKSQMSFHPWENGFVSMPVKSQMSFHSRESEVASMPL